MATYTKVYNNPYPNGWKSKPDLSTPYTTSIKDNECATFENIEDYLYNNPIGDISSASVGDLSDVDITGITNKQTLIWDTATSKFIPGSSGGANYSYDEQAIGEDEDGNTLYAKVFTKLPASGQEYIVTANGSSVSVRPLTNIDRVKNFYGMMYFDDGKQFPINYVDGYSLISESQRHIWTKAYYYPNRDFYCSANYMYYDDQSDQYVYAKIIKIRMYIEYYKV